jgi:SHS2 domain-containing protein
MSLNPWHLEELIWRKDVIAGACFDRDERTRKRIMAAPSMPGSKKAEETKGWEHFAHDADIGVRGFGATPAEAFEQTALALTAVVTDPQGVMPREAVSVRCSAADLEVLLVEWLNCLVFEMATRSMIFARFQVAIEGGTLEGMAWGEVVDVERHRPAAEIKGATFTELRVARADEGGWVAQCVVDV